MTIRRPPGSRWPPATRPARGITALQMLFLSGNPSSAKRRGLPAQSHSKQHWMGLSFMSGPDPDLNQARREEAGRWLAIVVDDIDTARAAMQLSPPRPGPAAFHLQQAAEKLVKA